MNNSQGSLTDAIRKALWIVGVLWFLSWFELYLEIYRYHHATLSSVLEPLSSGMATQAHSRPGSWLRTDLIGSAFAPPLFATLLLLRPTFGGREGKADLALPIVRALSLFGLLLLALGTINQLIWRPPMAVDLTLRHGNGGFIVVGGVLALAGSTLAWRRRVK